MPETAEYARQARYRYRPGGRCDHDSVLRFYSTEDRVLCCDGCGEPNRFLYCCAADTTDFSPMDVRRDVPTKLEDLFSPEMQRNIAAGHYTEEQVSKLIDQKINVLQQADNDLDKAFAEPRFTSNQEAYNLLQRQSVRDWIAWMRTQEGVINDGGIMPHLKEYMTFMPCQIRLCAVCQEHRNMAEKSFGSIDAILNDPGASHMPIPEFLSRPVIPRHTAANYPQGYVVQPDSTASTSAAASSQMAEPEAQIGLAGLGLGGLEEMASLEGLEQNPEATSTSEDTQGTGDITE